MPRTALALLLALALAAAGCASGRDTAVESPPLPPAPAPEPALPEDPPVPGGGAVAPGDTEPVLVDVQADAVDVAPRGWDEVFVLDDGQTLELRWWGGVEPCHVVAGVDVDHGEEVVTVTLLMGSAPSPDGEERACIEIARYTAVRVPLDEPVGQRSIVDGVG